MYSDYLPKNINDFILNENITKKLKQKNYNNLNHLLFYGIKGCGKKHIINNLIKYLFNTDNIITKNRKTDIKINNNNITVNFIESNYHYEINLYEYGLYDKHIITEFIKDIISTKNISNNLYKIIIIHKIDMINEIAQLTLRRIIESFSANCRFIITAENITKVNNALLSRFECIRIPFPEKTQLLEYCNYNNNKYNLKLDNEQIQTIISTDYNNYDLNCINYNLFHTFNNFNKFNINEKFDKIIKNETKLFMDELRKFIYKLHLLNYSYTSIIKTYLRHIINQNSYSKEEIVKIINKATECEYQCRLSKVFFFALEKFFIFIKTIYMTK